MTSFSSARHAFFRAGCLLIALLPMGVMPAFAALTDLASSPLETSTATLVKPNILFVLDDSGSMSYTYLPDWADNYDSTDAALRYNSRFNGLYYDPAVTYTPPLRYDSTSYSAMSATNTTNWTRVPIDGFGVQSTGVSNLAGTAPYYYTFIAGEYCTSTNLRTCRTQAAADATYPYPAYLRWCSGTALTNCQATYIEVAPTGGSSYTYPRYPARTAAVPGSRIRVTISSGTTSYAYPGTTAKAGTRTDCTGTTCTYSEEMTNYANWYAYYRTRMQMMKTATSLAFSTLGNNYRLGYMSINNNTNSDFLDVADNTIVSGGQKQAWYTKLTAAIPSDSTPLRTALSTAGRYYAGKLSNINNRPAIDPIQYACQRNYTMLSTDGYWNESSTSGVLTVDGRAIGDQDSSEVRPYLDGNATANTLADVAEYYYATDIRSSALGNLTNASGTDVSSNSYANKQQRMYTYTLGLGASGYMQYQSDYATATSGDYYNVGNGTPTSSATLSSGICSWQSSGACNWPVPRSNTQTAIDDLWHAAVNGRGTYYSATNSTELKTGLSSFLNSVDAASSSSAAVTLSTQNLSATAANYVFGTTFCSAKWFGELARYTLDPATGVPSVTAQWAQSGAGTDCTDSAGSLSTTPLLDRLAYASRNIYTWNAAGASRIQFEWGSLTSTMQGYFKIAAISSLSQLCTSGSNCLPAAARLDSTTAGTSTGAGGVNLVNYLRGDRSNEGTADTRYYFPRTHVLGDIVNSQALYVQAPTATYSDAGYAAFKSANASRQGMVYAGANDGMLHAFNADTGAESWAYIPTALLPSLYKLADKNYASNHQFFVDGATTQADVYYDSSWRTILVGGLGDGGRSFYALDVTIPGSPTVLWEFTHDTTKAAPYVTDADLGYSYGKPVVTKLSDGTWAVLVASGYNNVSPGSGQGVLWALNAKTGAIIKKMSTGVGTTTGGGTVAGCSVAPCPSGLAKVSAWVNSATDNTAKQVYGGDLYGNLWRFDISALTASGGSAPVQLLATLTDSSGGRQPITTRPELGYASDSHIVYVGTGAYLGVTDISTTQVQSIYAIKDPLTNSALSTGVYGSPRANRCGTSVRTQCFVQQVLSDSAGIRTATSTVSYATALATMYGWFADLPGSGERVDTDPTLQLGTLAYVSNIPSTSGACSVGGSSYLNYVNYSTGLTVSGASNTGVLLSSAGLSSSAVLALTTSGRTVAITKASDGTTQATNVPTTSSGAGTRRVWWRRLSDGQ